MNTEIKYFKKVKGISLLIVLGLIMTSQFVMAQTNKDAYQIDEFNVSGNVSLEVRTSGGSIQVESTDEDRVIVEMYVRHRSKYVEPGEADLDDYDIDISQDGNMVRAIVNRTSNNNWNWNDGYSISFIVYTPQQTRTRLKTSGGSLSVKNLKGSQELRTSGGSITANEIQGEMVLKTSGGSIKIANAQGSVDANTSGGTIRVETLSGNLEAKTSGGSISLSGVEGNVEARTSGGSINAEILAPAELIDLKTSGGSITITVPKGKGYDLDLDGNRVYAELENFSGEADRDEVRGTFNGGGTKVNAKTSGGAVHIKYL